MTVTFDIYTLAGLVAVLLAYPPVFRQARDFVSTTAVIIRALKRFVDLPGEVHRLELSLNEHESEVGLHNDHGGTT